MQQEVSTNVTQLDSATSGEKERHRIWRTIATAMVAIVAAGLAVGAVIAALSIYWQETRTTEDDVKSLIDANLTRGSTTDEIFRFLDSNNIDHGPIEEADSSCCFLQDTGIPSDMTTIQAIKRHTSRGFFGYGDIEIYFILNDKRELERYFVVEGFTGP